MIRASEIIEYMESLQDEKQWLSVPLVVGL